MLIVTQPSTDTAVVTNHTLLMPAPILRGDLLRGYIAYNNGTNALGFTWPADWHALSGGAGDNNGTNVGLAYAWKIAEPGDEGLASITVVSGAGCKSAHQVALIRPAHASTAPAIGVPIGATTINPNPPNLAPAWGARPTLYEVVTAYDLSGDATIVVSAYPASYTEGANPVVATTDGAGLGVARRLLAAASENPGTFTNSASEQTVTNTLAFRLAEPRARMQAAA